MSAVRTPQAEIVTVGDEIITGHTLDTNSVFLAQGLLTLGVTPRWRTSVGDTAADIEEALSRAKSRAEIILVTGGLGPTHDDITKASLARVFARPLVMHEYVVSEIAARYAARGLAMPEINRNQGLLPERATLLRNRLGSAVGIMIEEGGALCVALPGVPAEMRAIFSEELAPKLRGRFPGAQVAVRKLRTSGVIESALAERISALVTIPSSVRLAYLPSYDGVDLRLIAGGTGGDRIVTALGDTIRDALGELVYGEDEDTLESALGDLLRAGKARLALAESCTGGLTAARITRVAGSSDYFDRGFVTYTNRAKHEDLGAPADTLANFGAVSPETARAMAVGALTKSSADIAASVTGIAGPGGGSSAKPIGLVYVGIARKQGNTRTVGAYKFLFGADRTVNRERSVAATLNLLRLTLIGKAPKPLDE